MPLQPVTNPTRLNDPVNFPGLYQFIRQSLFMLEKSDVWRTDNPPAVQPLIDNFNPLAYAKQEKIKQIKLDGVDHAAAIFPILSNFDLVDLEAQRWQSLSANAKSPTASYTKLINTYTAAVNGITAVNAAATIAAVLAVTVTWP